MTTDQLTDREWRIVEALYRLMPDGPKMVNYEDVVVQAWNLYPDDFGLRGYSDRFPDASDVHKPLYNTLKSRGWVASGPRGQKKFALTKSGWERAAREFGGVAGETETARGRLSRTSQQELRHLERTHASSLYHDGDQAEILDTDFFSFYRTSVRASPQEFDGRLAEVDAALGDAERLGEALAKPLRDVDQYLRSRFADIVQAKSKRHVRGKRM